MTPNQQLRIHSGEVNSADPLVVFLYVLMRDYVTPGVVEGILQGHILPQEGPSPAITEFTNGYLAHYAQYVAERLGETHE